MNTERLVKGVKNSLTTSGDDVYDDTTAKWIGIAADGYDNTEDPAILIGDPIPYGCNGSVEYIDSQAEVTQIVFIGVDDQTNYTEETIGAAVKYGIQIVEAGADQIGKLNPEYKRGYTAPDTLSGVAATDRYTVYSNLVSRINAHESNNVTAYLCYKIAFTGGDGTGSGATGFATEVTTNKVTFGSPGEQQTSGVTANVAMIQITSGTFAGTDAAGYLWLYNFSDLSSWSSASKTFTVTDATNSEAVVVTTAATPTSGQGLVIVDDDNYWVSNKARGGICEVDLYEGFETATVQVVRLGKYSIGKANFMNTNLVPNFTRDKMDIVEGEGYYLTDVAMTAGKSYTTAIIRWTQNSTNALDSGQTPIERQMVVFLDESNGTNLTNFKSALTTALAK